jgi:hypothetical protein
MTRTRSGAPAITVIAVPVLTALALTACAGTDPERPSVASTATTDPSGTSAPAAGADPLDTVVAVVLRPDHLDLLDDAGTVVAEVSYDADAAEIASTLEVVFGAAPEIEEFAGRCCEAPRMTNYHWEGFSVFDDHMGHFTDDDERVWIDEDRPDDHGMNVSVSADAAAVGDVAVAAENGFAIGDDLGELTGAVEHPGGADWVQIPLETGPELGAPVIEGRPNAYSVVVQVNGPDAAPEIVAPLNLGEATV